MLLGFWCFQESLLIYSRATNHSGEKCAKENLSPRLTRARLILYERQKLEEKLPLTKEDRKGRIPEEEAATKEEVIQALEALDDQAEYHKLKLYAQAEARGLPDIHTPEDLIDQGVAKLLEGERRWRKDKQTIWECLRGIIQSGANHLYEEHKKKRGKTLVISPTGGHSTDPEAQVVMQVKSPSLTAEEQLVENEEEARKQKHFAELQALFASDEDVLKFIEGIICGFKGPEIQELNNWTPKEFDAIRKRFSYHVRTKFLRKRQS